MISSEASSATVSEFAKRTLTLAFTYRSSDLDVSAGYVAFILSGYIRPGVRMFERS
jgi:hypothetical protein